jgi:hypothetical protein
MDAANRIAIVAIALAMAFAALAVILLTWGAADTGVDRLQDFTEWLGEQNTGEGRVITTLGAAVVVLLAMAALVLELSPSDTRTVTIASGEGGRAVIEVETIAERVRAEVERTPHVTETAVKVVGRTRSVEIELDLRVDAYANLRDTAIDACGRARAVAEDVMGVPLASSPRARLRYRELRVAPRTDVAAEQDQNPEALEASAIDEHPESAASSETTSG